MKLLIAVIPNSIVENTLEKLLDAGIGATKLASTGGFGKKGNTTLLIGIEDEKYLVASKKIIKAESEKRKIQLLAENSKVDVQNMPGSTIMVLNMEEKEHY